MEDILAFWLFAGPESPEAARVLDAMESCLQWAAGRQPGTDKHILRVMKNGEGFDFLLEGYDGR